MSPARHGRVGVVTQARTSSTRLPGKVLAPLGATTVLGLHLDRLEASGLPVLVATTDNAGDDPVAELAEARGVPVHRGSEHDVLSRFAGCATEHDLDVVVRVTSDCPLVDGRLVLRGVSAWLAEDDPALYLSNCLERSFPRGLDFEVFSTAALLDADAHAETAEQREHVTPYLYGNVSGRTRLRNLGNDAGDDSDLRVTVDTAADLELVRRLVEDHGADRLDGAGIVEVLRAHPELVAINADVAQKPAPVGGAR